MTEDIRFYDTCSLLLAGEALFDKDQKFLISSISIKELERIKTSSNKDADVKYSARILQYLLQKYPDKYEVIIHKTSHEAQIEKLGLDIIDDTRILSDAIWANNIEYPDAIIFVTNDLALYNMANLYFGDQNLESIEEEQDDYLGYKEITPTDEELENFYQNPNYNHYNLYVGQYLILRDNANSIIDVRVWTGKEHRYLRFGDFNSQWFGKVKPYNGDIYQKLLFDSLSNNKITLVKGPPGSGKTMVSLAFLMSKMEHGELDKIIVFCNTVATANSAKLGYYPGDKNSKLLDSQIGNLLISKFGGIDGVNRLISENKLILLPLSDIRGYDTSGMRAGVYISEAQNLDRTLMKLALQRIGEDSICIIDGDEKSQVDLPVYAGVNNGMRRASKVFRGSSIYGEVALKTIYRSAISRIAENI